MIIPISEELRIRGTELCWELQRRRSRKGESCWEAFKYYSTFGQALEGSVHREIRLHPAHTLADAIEAVSGIVRRYEELIPDKYRLAQ